MPGTWQVLNDSCYYINFLVLEVQYFTQLYRKHQVVAEKHKEVYNFQNSLLR